MAVKWDAERKQYVSEFCQRGIRIFQRMPHGITKAQADEWEVKKRRELFEVGPLGNRPEITLPAAIGLWLQNNRRKNQAKALSEAKQWEPWVKGRLLREAPEVAQAAVKEWSRGQSVEDAKRRSRRPMSARIASSATINRRLCVLKAAAKMAWKQGLIAENVSGRITLFRENNMREIYLTRAQVMTLASKAPSPECRSAILIAAWTGLRASEVLALPATATRAATLSVLQTNSKSGKPRSVPIHASLRPLLSSLPLPLSYWQLHKQFLVARKGAGLKGLRFHDLRHTAASWLINADVDLYTVGKILGHAGPQTTARYAHLADKTLRRAIARIK